MNPVTEVEIGAWLKSPGQAVKDEPVVTLESEKATVELAAPETGIIGRVLKEKGETAKVGEVIAYLGKKALHLLRRYRPAQTPSHSAETWTRGTSQTH